ncbi:hypothetical protein NE237_019219 [Protea cynaroides]|uniref:Uncharacterized protein n=1 Tax=Protea cynaroides TaxID=273540 RepID=A0A9Q0KBG5_9MAGN|nr:hypothetical protein NE237_019219 [Protea cynaroides]
MDSIWSDHGVPNSRHFLIAIYFAFGFGLARLFLDSFVFRRLAIWSLNRGAVPVKIREAVPVRIREAKEAKIAKFSESMWKLTYYASVQVCILTITYHEPWFRDTKEYFKGWPNQGPK